MAKDRSVSTKAIPPPARKDGDGKEIGNLILLALPRKERTQIFSSLEFVRLNLHHLMHEAGEVIKSAYFLNNGMIMNRKNAVSTTSATIQARSE